MYLHFVSIIYLGWCFLTLKSESCHDANFVVTDEAGGPYRATSEDKVGIKAMITTTSSAPSENNWHHENSQGAVSIRKTVLPGMAIPMLKIRRPNGRLIFNMEIAIRR